MDRYSSTLDAFPYSLFYIYFEQYLALKQEAIRSVLLALGKSILSSQYENLR